MAKFIINKEISGLPAAFTNVEIEAQSYQFSDGYFVFYKAGTDKPRVFTIIASQVLTISRVSDS